MSAADALLETKRADLAASERRIKILSLRLELAMLRRLELFQSVAALEREVELERSRPTMPPASGWIRPRGAR